MEETISLKELLYVLRKRLLLIVACMVGAASIAAAVSFYFLTPKYESSSQFIVNQKQQSSVQFDVNDIQTNLELINTYIVIIKSRAILDDVVNELKLPYDAMQLEKNIQVSSEQDSQVVTVQVTDTNQARATKIVNTTVEIFQKKTPEIMNSVDNITILTKAEEQTNPKQVAPKPAFNIVIAIVLGAMIAVGIAFLLEYLNTTITTEEDIKEKLNLPVLGAITTITNRDLLLSNQEKSRSKKRKGEDYMFRRKKRVKDVKTRCLITKLNPRSPISEQFRTVRTNLQFSSVDELLQTILITSPEPGAGKSLTAANLAVTYAQQGKKVLLVDADMRKPTVHYTFRLNNLQGLSNILIGECALEAAIVSSGVNHLDLISCGPIPPNPAELLASSKMANVLTDARKIYDFIILDTPPVLALADAQILSNIVDGALLVIRSKYTTYDLSKKAKELLETSKAKLLGVVLNDVDKKISASYKYYYDTH